MLSAPDVLDIEDDDFALIEGMAEQLNSKTENALKPLFDELDGEFEYGVLKCIVSGMAG